MRHPPVSIVVPTYGRTQCLSETLECFLRQDYPGEMELVIVSDACQQSLRTNLPHVSVHNLPERCPTIGAKRNATIAEARFDLFLMIDDDDTFLPWYVRTMVTAYLAAQSPVWTSAYFHSEGRGAATRMRLVQSSIPGTYLMDRDQFKRVGPYPPANVIEDQLLRTAARKLYPAHPDVEPGFVYRWANNVFHISGSREHDTVMTRAEQNLQARIQTGEEPSGDILLTPTWEADYVELARNAQRVAMGTPNA